MVLKFSDPRLMHRTVPSGVDISAEYMFDYRTHDDSPITRFMHGKCVLLTGATGFLGSLFLEKCLRVGASRVYVLCRPKDGKTVKQRIEELLDQPIFVKLTAMDPEFPARIRVLSGDLTQPHLGLTNAADIALCQNVQLIIHTAASQRLTRSLGHLLRTNVFGTKQLLRLGQRISQLELFVHLSPVYAQLGGDHTTSSRHVEERFYVPHLEPNVMLGVADRADDKEFEVLTDRICWPWPDAVSFSRVMAEELVRRCADRLPTSVVRPSMLIATSIDPIPGWCPQPFGLNGLLTAIAFGFIRMHRIFCSVNPDLICADYVVNSTLAIAWDVCKTKASRFEIPAPKVFHLTSGTHNPISAAQFVQHLRHVGHDLATWRTIWWPFRCVLVADTEQKWLHLLLTLAPAWLADLWGSRQMLLLFRQFEGYLGEATRLMAAAEGTFANHNVLAVYDRMTDFDRDTRFPCDIRAVNWKQYIFEYALGARLYLMQEPFESVRQAVRRRRNVRIVAGLALLVVAVYFYVVRMVV